MISRNRCLRKIAFLVSVAIVQTIVTIFTIITVITTVLIVSLLEVSRTTSVLGTVSLFDAEHILFFGLFHDRVR